MKPRKIFQSLLKQKKDKKVSLLIGARQVGKTTILKALHKELSAGSKAVFLDLDIYSNYERVNTFENFVNTLKLNGYDENQSELFYVFLDEFQRYPGLTLIIKNIYDNFDNIKIYASGSSSIKIKNEIQESLAGRKRTNNIYPLSFEEFLWFKEDEDAIQHLHNIRELKGKQLKQPTSKLLVYLTEFMVSGGYPEVVLENDKAGVLESIFDLYVKKDLLEYLDVSKISLAKRLIEYLAINNGQKIKYNDIGQVCSLRYKDVLDYVELLKETYLIIDLRPFFSNKNSELVKIPKIYFMDNGVRNYFINNFNPVNMRNDSGFLFEGFVLSELLKSGIKTDVIKFWQDKNKHEVDIVLDFIRKQIPIEIKYKENLKHEDFLGLKAFCAMYPKTHTPFLINLNRQEQDKKYELILPYDLSFISNDFLPE
jgi:hypothetical protein